MGAHRFGSLLRLAGDAVLLEFEFGAQSLEALAWIAQTVENSVYVRDSLTRTPTGFRFSLANPPLRIGAFSELRLLVEGTAIPGDRVRFRLGPGQAWRTSAELSGDHPLELEGGSGLEFEADWAMAGVPETVTVRLELQSVAIPPLVWIEFREAMREAQPS